MLSGLVALTHGIELELLFPIHSNISVIFNVERFTSNHPKILSGFFDGERRGIRLFLQRHGLSSVGGPLRRCFWFLRIPCGHCDTWTMLKGRNESRDGRDHDSEDDLHHAKCCCRRFRLTYVYANGTMTPEVRTRDAKKYRKVQNDTWKCMQVCENADLSLSILNSLSLVLGS